MEKGIMRWATSNGGLAGAHSMNIQTLAEETGGEVLEDKPQSLDSTFNTLVTHLRTRHSLAFVSSNKKRHGSLPNLNIQRAPATHNSQRKHVLTTRRSY